MRESEWSIEQFKEYFAKHPDLGRGRRRGVHGRRNKFGNKRTIVHGIKFDSQREATRYLVLKNEEKRDSICDLKLQVPYELAIDGQVVCKYVADFVYMRKGMVIVEDAKGFRTRDYKLKKRLMKALHGIEILET